MGRYIIDAKSALGVYALDLRKPIDVEIHSDDEEEIKRFNMVMEEFKIDENVIWCLVKKQIVWGIKEKNRVWK